ncbi:uncharacterized protein QC761_118460 [Podospora bellae-mahoneyi]|uniref:Yippee/Mis18/Cereblon domain-containing protein n=1 Tax=Podospora bellae-mahoneyi TaxID=2093777 RepID=A0ABR0G113_9PEZI|nr:hypothetical protein QC761_118460 [Podospora bellae-mahoneyi]
MKTASCECKKCQASVGSFSNLWIRIGNSYLGPVIQSDEDLAIRCEGTTRIGGKGTLVEGCHLQTLFCDGCAAILGFRCIETPVNHVLDDNQVLLRIASVNLLGEEREELEPEVKRVLSINEPSRTSNGGPPYLSSNSPSTLEFQQLKFDLEGQKDYLRRIDNNGFRIVAGLDKRVARVESDSKTLQETVSGFKGSILGVQDSLKSLLGSELNGIDKCGTEQKATLEGLRSRVSLVSDGLDMIQQQATDLAEELREEVSDLKNQLEQTTGELDILRAEIKVSVSADNYARDMAAMRTEIAQLRRDLHTVRSNEHERVAPSFPSRELEILTSNIAKIGNRASKVETLQMEFEILKGRVDRAEANYGASNDRRAAYPLDPETSLPHPGAKKRASSPKPEPVSKRRVPSDQFSDYTVSGHSAAPLTPLGQSSTTNLQNPKKRGRPKTAAALSNSGGR